MTRNLTILSILLACLLLPRHVLAVVPHEADETTVESKMHKLQQMRKIAAEERARSIEKPKMEEAPAPIVIPAASLSNLLKDRKQATGNGFGPVEKNTHFLGLVFILILFLITRRRASS